MWFTLKSCKPIGSNLKNHLKCCNNEVNMACLDWFVVHRSSFIVKLLVFIFALFTLHFSLFTPTPTLADWKFDAILPICTISPDVTSITAGSSAPIITVPIAFTATYPLGAPGPSLIKEITVFKGIVDITSQSTLEHTPPYNPLTAVYNWSTAGLPISPPQYAFSIKATTTAGNTVNECAKRSYSLIPGPTATPAPGGGGGGGGGGDGGLTPPPDTPTPTFAPITATPTPFGYNPAWLQIIGGDTHVNK